jgi:serine/threonine-protein kinase
MGTFAKVNPVADLAPACDSAATGRGQGDPRLGTFAGNYRLVARLGEGGMAAVYRGEHRDITGALVAVKLLDRRWSATPGTTRRFLREAQAMFELMGGNRHIPRVLDYGRTENGESYMVMEYLRGRDLAQVLQQEGPLPWPRVARLTLQLCDALAAGHTRDILHRDIKPANCFLVEEGEGEIVKLIDFGIAKELRAVADPTAVGTIVGTPAYLAPELAGHRLSPAARGDPASERPPRSGSAASAGD